MLEEVLKHVFKGGELDLIDSESNAGGEIEEV